MARRATCPAQRPGRSRRAARRHLYRDPKLLPLFGRQAIAPRQRAVHMGTGRLPGSRRCTRTSSLLAAGPDGLQRRPRAATTADAPITGAIEGQAGGVAPARPPGDPISDNTRRFKSMTVDQDRALGKPELLPLELSMPSPFAALTGRTVLVTGGGSGLGAATAEVLAATGMCVAVADLLPETAETCADRISADGGRAIGIGAGRPLRRGRPTSRRGCRQVGSAVSTSSSTAPAPMSVCRSATSRRRRSTGSSMSTCAAPPSWFVPRLPHLTSVGPCPRRQHRLDGVVARLVERERLPRLEIRSSRSLRGTLHRAPRLSASG